MNSTPRYKVFRVRLDGGRLLNIFSWRLARRRGRSDFYTLARLDCPVLAYRLAKLQCSGTDQEEEQYEISITDKTCSCKGFAAHGHKHPCKHLLALLQLLEKGKLP